MRLLFITQSDPFYIKTFFDTFFGRYGGRWDINAVAISKTMGKPLSRLAPQLLGFYGPIDFFRVALRYARVKLLGATLGRIVRDRPFTLEQLCRSHGIETIPDVDVNSTRFVQDVAGRDIDVIVSVAAPQIFKRPLLKVPRIGCINVHSARLPQYRGMMPNFWVMYNNEKVSAITVHSMDTKIDRGRILLQREFALDPAESHDRLIRRTKVLAAGYVHDALEIIKERGIVPQPVDDVEPTYYSFPTREHVKRFRQQGMKLL